MIIMILFGWKWKKKKDELEKKIQILENKLKKASLSIKSISKGNFELKEDEKGDEVLNSLKELSDQMKEYDVQEKQRRWISEGMVRFVDILRKDQSKKEELYQQILSSLVKYLNANQGGIFLVGTNGYEPVLEMVAAYAYDKKRFFDKTIKIGEGLLGQCFLEEATTVYSDLPPFYTTITSGMGEATPGCLLLVPLKFNDQVVGVMEIAAFDRFQEYEIDFVEKIAESIASVSFNIQNTEKTKSLLAESGQREQMLKEQEEELRQNLEELVATQDEMQQKQKEIDQKGDMMKLIIDNIPFPVFVKDEIGRYTLVNKAEAALFNMPVENIVGKDDSHFVENEQEWKVIQESDLRTLDSEIPIELPVQSFTTSVGTTHVFKTTKIPFVNSLTGQKNILGVSVDLTEKLKLEKELLKENLLSKNNILIDIAGRQRMLSQKIGFYSEMIFRGKVQHIEELRNTIALHDHSLSILKNGGTPKGIENAMVLDKAGKTLLPALYKVEEVWEKYKKAAENIIELKSNMEEVTHEAELLKWIQVIEEKGESMLEVNNELLKACYQKNKKQAVELSSQID
jgi:PAS domain S-box-containing protein